MDRIRQLQLKLKISDYPWTMAIVRCVFWHIIWGLGERTISHMTDYGPSDKTRGYSYRWCRWSPTFFLGVSQMEILCNLSIQENILTGTFLELGSSFGFRRLMSSHLRWRNLKYYQRRSRELTTLSELQFHNRTAARMKPHGDNSDGLLVAFRRLCIFPHPNQGGYHPCRFATAAVLVAVLAIKIWSELLGRAGAQDI